MCPAGNERTSPSFKQTMKPLALASFSTSAKDITAMLALLWPMWSPNMWLQVEPSYFIKHVHVSFTYIILWNGRDTFSHETHLRKKTQRKRIMYGRRSAESKVQVAAPCFSSMGSPIFGKDLSGHCLFGQERSKYIVKRLPWLVKREQRFQITLSSLSIWR